MDPSGLLLLLLLSLSGALCAVVPWPELDEAKVTLIFYVYFLFFSNLHEFV